MGLDVVNLHFYTGILDKIDLKFHDLYHIQFLSTISEPLCYLRQRFRESLRWICTRGPLNLGDVHVVEGPDSREMGREGGGGFACTKPNKLTLF